MKQQSGDIRPGMTRRTLLKSASIIALSLCLSALIRKYGDVLYYAANFS
jgi:hypothetical protein